MLRRGGGTDDGCLGCFGREERAPGKAVSLPRSSLIPGSSNGGRPGWNRVRSFALHRRTDCGNRIYGGEGIYHVMSLDELRDADPSACTEHRPLFSPDDRVGKAIGHMRKEGVYEVFAAKGGRLLASTTRDILGVSNPQSTRLGSILRPVSKVDGGATLGAVAAAMYEQRSRAIPVSIRGGVLTVVSARRVLLMLSQYSASHPASKFMTPNPVTVGPSDSALKARRMMIQMGIDHLPVVEGKKTVGMLTSSQLMYNLLPSARVPSRSDAPRSGVEKAIRFDYPVRNISGDSVLEVAPETPISEVVRRIIDEESSYALVSRWGELMGIVTLRDLMRLIPSAGKKEPRCYMVGLPDDPFEGEAAKMKFEKLSRALAKAFPQVEETRAVIKSKKAPRGRGRYEVSVSVYSPREMYTYSEEGNDLPEIFDLMAPRIKRILTSRGSKVTRSQGRSIRKDAGS